MKRYIKSNIDLSQGSYLLARDGTLIESAMHVPSTTFVGRDILHLVPTDAQFLLDQNKISEDDATVILHFCLVEYLTQIKGHDKDYITSPTDIIEFGDWAEMRFAQKLRGPLMICVGTFQNILSSEEVAQFNKLNEKWYIWLKNNFVKVSVFNNTVEFRISSEDGFDWNEVIIDDTILKYDDGRSSTRYTITRESSKGYKAYFMDATKSDILENDNIILSSTILSRKVINNKLIYS